MKQILLRVITASLFFINEFLNAQYCSDESTGIRTLDFISAVVFSLLVFVQIRRSKRWMVLVIGVSLVINFFTVGETGYPMVVLILIMWFFDSQMVDQLEQTKQDYEQIIRSAYNIKENDRS